MAIWCRSIGLILAITALATQPSWGQVGDPPEEPDTTAPVTPGPDVRGPVNYAVGPDRSTPTAPSDAAATDAQTQEDAVSEARTEQKAKRERLTERKYLYYTYPPAYRYPAKRPYYYRSNVGPAPFYGGYWPRGYRLGPILIDPNVGNAGFTF